MIPLRTNHVYWARVNIKSMPDVVAIPSIHLVKQIANGPLNAAINPHSNYTLLSMVTI